MPECLFCRSEDGPFLSEEHVLPQSMGNTTLVVPKGVICDKCNNGKLSQLDEYLLNFFPIKFLRVQYGIKSKKGKSPMAKFGNVHMEMDRPGNINIKALNRRAIKYLPDGFELNVSDGRPFTDDTCKMLVRELYKITLELMYLDNPRIAYSKRFDEVRKIVLGIQDFSGYIALSTTAKVRPEGRVAYNFTRLPDGKRTVWVIADLLGFVMMTDLETRKPYSANLPMAEQFYFRLF